MKYGYVRVSSSTQNLDRQLVEMKNIGISRRRIYADKQSGKNFEREQYQKLKAKLKKGDVLFIKSIDRLGRNYQMIIEEWSEIIKVIGADIVVIDMPLLDTRTNQQNLVGKFISDIVLQILSFVAQNERENIKSRQAEGIKTAKLNGIRFGRPKFKLPRHFKIIQKQYRGKKLKLGQAIDILNMNRSTFYKYVRIFEEREKRREQKRHDEILNV